jgi:hypothetical protein
MAATLRGAAKAAPKIAPGNLLLLALCPDPGEGLSVEFLSLALRSVAYHEQSACRAVSEEQSGAKRRSEELPGKPTGLPPSRGADGQADCAAPPE